LQKDNSVGKFVLPIAGKPVSVIAKGLGSNCDTVLPVTLRRDNADTNRYFVRIGDKDRGILTLSKTDLAPTFYRQGNSPWGITVYDNHPDSAKMSKKGCGTTSLSNAINAFGIRKNPGELNDWLKNNKGYNGTSVSWAAVEKIWAYCGTIFQLFI
jgi:hypothetical protein